MNEMGIGVRAMRAEDAEQVLAIYQAGLDTGDASFETDAPTWEVFDAAKLPGHRFVATGGKGKVLGWIAASAVSERCCYAGSSNLSGDSLSPGSSGGCAA